MKIVFIFYIKPLMNRYDVECPILILQVFKQQQEQEQEQEQQLS